MLNAVMVLSTRSIFSIFCILALTVDSIGQETHRTKIVIQLAHSSEVAAVAYSPTGRHIASGGRDNTLKLWDVASGSLLHTLVGHTDIVRTLKFSPDGRFLLSATQGDTKIRAWNVETGELVHQLEGKAQQSDAVLLFTPDGKRAIVAGGYSTRDLKEKQYHSNKTIQNQYIIQFWDMKSGQRTSIIKGHLEDISSAAISTDGKTIATAGYDKLVKIWGVKTGKELATLDAGDVVGALQFSNDGSQLYMAKWEGEIVKWHFSNSDSAKITQLKAAPSSFEAFDFHENGSLLIGGSDGTLIVWNTLLGRADLTLKIANEPGFQIGRRASPSPDGKFLAFGGQILRLFASSNGKLVKTFGKTVSGISDLRFSRDGGQISAEDTQGGAAVWNVNTGRLERSYPRITERLADIKTGASPSKTLVGYQDGKLVVRDVASGRKLKSIAITSDSEYLRDLQVLPNLNLALLSGVQNGEKGETGLWNTRTGKLINRWPVSAIGPGSMDLSTDGRLAAVTDGYILYVFDNRNGKQVFKFENDTGEHSFGPVAFSRDARLVAAGAIGEPYISLQLGNLRVWNVATGRLVASLGGHSAGIIAIAFSPNGRLVASSGWDNEIKVWDLASSKLLHTFVGHTGSPTVVRFSPKSDLLASGGADGTVRIWSISTGEALTTSIRKGGGVWTTLSRSGFFNGPSKEGNLIAVVREGKAHSPSQFRDHLYRPDLVEELLKGDPEGKYRDAASKLNLEKILDSGPAPQIELLEKKTEQAGGTVRLSVRLKDEGGGIGTKLVWRVNGKTQGNVTPEALKGLSEPSLGEAVTVTQTLVVDPGQDNLIEVTAYNDAGLLATPPFEITVDKFGATTKERPRMHVLAIGVDNYLKKEYQLSYAVKDATTVRRALGVVGSTLFSKVDSTLLTNEQVTAEGIEAAFTKIAATAKPTDVFVLFLAGHGKSIEGKYYYYPQTLNFDAGQTVIKHGISQDQWQAWLAKLPVQKTLLILDTCESSAATGLVRGSNSVRRTAMQQLQHATGHNLIAAARQAAYEGYKGHGVLTYSLLEALHRTATQKGEQRVKVGQLADHIDERVPQISQILTGIYQKPTRKLAGNDFPIGLRRAVLTSTTGDIPKTPTHVIIRSATIREQPKDRAPAGRTLKPGTLVRVVKFVGDWAIVARDGQRMGYVKASQLLKTQ